MPREKITASGIVFDNAIEVIGDMFDFTIERHAEDIAAQAVYTKMREIVAEMRRNLRRLLKKSWFKGPERQRCLRRARELREAELALGYLIKASSVSTEMNAYFLDNVKNQSSMTELMSHFKIKAVRSGRRRK